MIFTAQKNLMMNRIKCFFLLLTDDKIYQGYLP